MTKYDTPPAGRRVAAVLVGGLQRTTVSARPYPVLKDWSRGKDSLRASISKGSGEQPLQPSP
ncbi:hypothetical protein GCM10009839_33440 [Catenulispora yoronensis]|uniref:Uncharacterized protein n=1 Tax=Catenulispora yoronensis TaxID=450799 RepID=A0ABP5FSW6_9ACTN